MVLRRRPQYHILCECEALASLRYIYPSSFLLDLDSIKKLGVGAIWRFGNAPWENAGHKGPVVGPRCIGSEKGSNPYIILFYSTHEEDKVQERNNRGGE